MVVPGDSGRMSSIIGNRKNLHHSGTTSGNSLQECCKSNLQCVAVVPTSDKHRMMGSAGVKDDSRSTQAARGRAHLGPGTFFLKEFIVIFLFLDCTQTHSHTQVIHFA